MRFFLPSIRIICITRENRRCRVKTDDMKYNIFILYFVFKAKIQHITVLLFIVLELYAN